MGLLKILFIIFILIFPLTEAGRIQYTNGVAISINDVFLFLTIITWVVYRLTNKQKVKAAPKLKKPILIFLLVALISLLVNIFSLNFQSVLISALYPLRWFCYALIYFMVFGFDPGFKRLINKALLISGFLVVLAGYIQFFFYPNLKNLYYLGWDDHLYRMFSTFLDPNYAGAFFVIYFLFTLNLVFKYWKIILTPKPFLILLSCILTLGAVYLTYSRSAFLMLAVGLLSFLWFKGKRKLIFISAVILILLIFATPKAFKLEGTNFLRVVSTEQRYYSVRQALDVFYKSPILGVGFNTYRYALNRAFKLNGALWQTTHAGAGTDNSFLFVLATTGVIGFSVFIYFLYKMFSLGKQKISSSFGIVFLSIFLGFLVDSLFINSLFYVLLLEWIWIIAALTESS